MGRVSAAAAAAAAAAVATYQYSKRTLSETSPSPVGPSARQSPFTDAEHGFLPFSLLPPSSFFLATSVQTQIPVTSLVTATAAVKVGKKS